MSGWKYDAKQDDPLTALRIPVVTSRNPDWAYLAAYLDVAPVSSYRLSPPMGSAARPTDLEARQIQSFIDEYREHWYRPHFKEKLLSQPLDVDGGAQTTIFIKYGKGDWAYRMAQWTRGHLYTPPYPAWREEHPEESGTYPLTLEQVMDLRHTIDGRRPIPRWREWKAAHPEIFPSAPTSA
jgi:hypothetical protein